MSTRANLDERVNLRIAPEMKANLLKAAQASKQSLTAFVLNSAVARAEDVLSSRTTFQLSAKDWRKFNELLDAPSREIPALKRLLREESIFEKG